MFVSCRGTHRPAGGALLLLRRRRRATSSASTPTARATPPRRDWLANDLATTTRKWKFVFLHQTPYSCANGVASIGSDTTVRTTWGPIFEHYGVDIVFDGHDHIYERSIPLDDFADADGTPGSDGTHHPLRHDRRRRRDARRRREGRRQRPPYPQAVLLLARARTATGSRAAAPEASARGVARATAASSASRTTRCGS